MAHPGATLLVWTALPADRCHQSHRRRRRLVQRWIAWRRGESGTPLGFQL